MVHNQYHSTGLGKRLLLERLNRITQHLEVTFIRLDTSQYTFGFFEKLGFVTQKITLSGYWPGLDRYDMKLSLDVAVQPRLQSIYQGVWP
jgi:ribosomal protein S18 acetylase RimI-like enzyme